MVQRLLIHPRVLKRHPQLTEEDVRFAWFNSYYEALRTNSVNFPEFLWIGRDKRGREIEMVGTQTNDGWLIYHANTPLSKRTKAEIRNNERRP